MAQNLKKTAQKMKKKGRFGDSELVHVNPIEKKMLEDMAGGIKSKNPDTGLDEHFWSILIPAGIGALTGAMNGGGLKGALKGALIGGATAGIGSGIGGMMDGSGFMSGLSSMFGGIGAGPGYSAAIGPLNPAQSAGKIAMASQSLSPVSQAISSAAPVGAIERTFGDRAKDFFSTPQGLIAASSALGMLTDDGKDPYADEAARKKAEDKNYPIYNNGMRYAEGGEVFDQNNPTRINVGGLQPYTGSMAAFQPYTVDNAAIGNTDFGKETYTPRTPSAAETAAASAPAANPEDSVWWRAPYSKQNLKFADLAGSYQSWNNQDKSRGMKGWTDPFNNPYEGMTESDWQHHGFIKMYADGGAAKKRDVHTESDTTRSPQLDPRVQKKMLEILKEAEKRSGRYLDEDEMQDLMGRMGGGIGQMTPVPYAAGGPVAGIGGGKDDKIKALLSDGEHVITADEVSMLGDGSNDAGHKKLYDMRKKLRKHKTGRTKQMPKAKSPEAYAGIGA